MIAYQSQQHSPALDLTAPDSIVDRMVAAMQDMRAAGQIITAETLAVWGDFTEDDVTHHAREAADLARARSIRQVA